MNTEQRAKAWLTKTIDVTDITEEISQELCDAQFIMTDLLTERQELLMHVHRLLFIAKHAQKYMDKIEEQNNE